MKRIVFPILAALAIVCALIFPVLATPSAVHAAPAAPCPTETSVAVMNLSYNGNLVDRVRSSGFDLSRTLPVNLLVDFSLAGFAHFDLINTQNTATLYLLGSGAGLSPVTQGGLFAEQHKVLNNAAHLSLLSWYCNEVFLITQQNNAVLHYAAYNFGGCNFAAATSGGSLSDKFTMA